MPVEAAFQTEVLEKGGDRAYGTCCTEDIHYEASTVEIQDHGESRGETSSEYILLLDELRDYN